MAADRKRNLNAGRWQLERERYQLPAEWEPPSDVVALPAGEIAAALLKKAGLDDRLWERTVIEEWPTLVGEAVARHARPGQLVRGVLAIYVTNATWLNELARYGKDEMLKKLQTRFGVDRIKDLRFQPDPDLPSAASRRPPPHHT